MGKWFLDHEFYLPNAVANQQLFGDYLQPAVVKLIDELMAKKANLGMLDPYRANQLISEPPLEIAEPMVSKSQYERFRCNVFTPIRQGKCYCEPPFSLSYFSFNSLLTSSAQDFTTYLSSMSPLW
jgi:hypothetical protein